MIETARLVLRGWRDDDIDPFAAMCRDQAVMAWIGPLQSRDEVAATVARQRALEARLGHCFWAVERRDDSRFIGFCGLKPGAEGTPIAGLVEIGWRLARDCWGQGYAGEAARAALEVAWGRLAADAVWAITVPANLRSRALMRRLCMHRRNDLDFAHPALAADDPLSRHITCVIERPATLTAFQATACQVQPSRRS